ncbi:MAG: hypothetical protein EON98_10035, partial [Chitinophagaceae bacterium]
MLKHLGKFSVCVEKMADESRNRNFKTGKSSKPQPYSQMNWPQQYQQTWQQDKKQRSEGKLNNLSPDSAVSKDLQQTISNSNESSKRSS